MTALTPIYGLKYLVAGEPVRNTRQALEDNAFTIEAALQAGGVAAPGASDLLTLAGRVTALETDQAAEDTARAAQAIPFAAGFAQYTTAPMGELLRCWKPTPDLVHIVGMVLVTTAVAATGTAVTVGTIPAGYRPAVNLNRTVWISTANVVRALVTTAGLLQLTPTATGGLAVGNWLQFDLTYRLVNT